MATDNELNDRAILKEAFETSTKVDRFHCLDYVTWSTDEVLFFMDKARSPAPANMFKCPNCNELMEYKVEEMMGEKCESWVCLKCQDSYSLCSKSAWNDMYIKYHDSKKALEAARQSSESEIQDLKIRITHLESTLQFERSKHKEQVGKLHNKLKERLETDVLKVHEVVDEIFPDCAENPQKPEVTTTGDCAGKGVEKKRVIQPFEKRKFELWLGIRQDVTNEEVIKIIIDEISTISEKYKDEKGIKIDVPFSENDLKRV